MKLFACKTFRLLKQNAVIWERPTIIAKFQSLARQISQFRGHFENRLEKMKKIELLRINAIFVHWI